MDESKKPEILGSETPGYIAYVSKIAKLKKFQDGAADIIHILQSVQAQLDPKTDKKAQELTQIYSGIQSTINKLETRRAALQYQRVSNVFTTTRVLNTMQLNSEAYELCDEADEEIKELHDEAHPIIKGTIKSEKIPEEERNQIAAIWYEFRGEQPPAEEETARTKKKRFDFIWTPSGPS